MRIISACFLWFILGLAVCFEYIVADRKIDHQYTVTAFEFCDGVKIDVPESDFKWTQFTLSVPSVVKSMNTSGSSAYYWMKRHKESK